MKSPSSPHEEERLGLGLVLTALQLLVYASFVAACSFNDAFITGLKASNGVPYSFLFGLVVIATGAVLTTVYVAVTNRSEEPK
jgi:uncharacterized membrane protein (DUF485 family)